MSRISSKVEVKGKGEVFTPFWLINDMLDTLPVHVWSNPNLKWFDPASGTGNFQVVILARLMVGLKDAIKDEKERYKHIMKNMVYTCEISDKNTFLYKNNFNPNNEFKLNHFYGDFLSPEFDEHMKNVWNFKFDIIVGNPPYQILKPGFKKSQPLWDKFVEKSFSLLENCGYFTNVHPNGWRNVNGIFKNVQNIIKERDLLYLEIHNDSDGLKTFGAAIKYDFYCVKNTKTNLLSKVKCQNGKIVDIDISKMTFIPDGEFDVIENLIAKDGEEKVEILYSRSAYGTDKNNTSKIQDSQFKFPCVCNVSKKENITLMYSNTKNNGHFIPKIICGSASSGTNFFIDKSGDYGITQFSFGIVENENNLEKIYETLKSEKFQKMAKNIPNNSQALNYRILSTFRKDFWKDFI